MKTKCKIQQHKDHNIIASDFVMDRKSLNKFPHLSIVAKKRESAFDATIAKKAVLTEPNYVGAPYGVKPLIKQVGKLMWKGPHFLIFCVNDKLISTPANEFVVNPGDRVTWFQISKAASGRKSV